MFHGLTKFSRTRQWATTFKGAYTINIFIVLLTLSKLLGSKQLINNMTHCEKFAAISKYTYDWYSSNINIANNS